MVLNAGTAAPRLIGEVTGGERPDVVFTATPLTRSGDPAEALDIGRLVDAPFKLPAGTYEIDATLLPGGATTTQTAVIAAGQETELGIRFETGLARVELLDKEGGTPVPGARWVLRDEDTGHEARILGGTAEISLPPGSYDVTAESGEDRASGSVEIVAGATQELSLVMPQP